MNGDKIGLRALSASLIMHCSFCCFALTEERQEEGSGRSDPRKEETPEGGLMSLATSYVTLFYVVSFFLACAHSVSSFA